MSNSRAAFDYYVSQGLEPHQAAGIVGNLQGESGQELNPLAVNPGDGRDGSDSIGIAQWNGTRAQALKEFAASKGVPWSDLNIQLEFLHSELKGPEKSAFNRLMAAATPEEAGQAMLAFERPKNWNVPGAHPERARYAAAAMTAYGGQPSSVPTAPLNLVPQPAPIFAPRPQQPDAAPQQAAGRGALMPAPEVQNLQAPPIFVPPRRSPDLSKLRAAFQQRPIFNRG